MRTLRRGLSTRTARAVGQWVMPVERGPVSVKFKAVSANDNLDERGLAKVSSHLDTLELCLNLQKYDPWTGKFIADTCKTLVDTLGDPAGKIVPLFAELFAAKE